MRLAWAFFQRDALIELSYKTSFAFQLLNGLLVLLVFYFIGSLMPREGVPELARFGGDPLAFILVGVALQDCVAVSLNTFGRQIREGQLTGTLEATLMSPVSLPTILAYSSLWNYFLSAIRFGLYLLVGVPLYGVDMSNPDVLATVVIFLLTVFSFAGIGMMWASLIMFVKRGEGIATMFGYGLILVSGVLVPVETLPPAIQTIAAFVPLTHALDGMRYALLQGAGLWDPNVRQSVLELLGFSVALLTLGIGAFTLSVHHAKRNGTLTEY